MNWFILFVLFNISLYITFCKVYYFLSPEVMSTTQAEVAPCSILILI
jgi:hypothetical protein